MITLINRINKVHVGEAEDPNFWCWLKSKDGEYSVRSGYQVIVGDQPSFPIGNFIWKFAVHSKAAFLVWLVSLDKTLTVDKLKAQGVHMLNRCSLRQRRLTNTSSSTANFPFAVVCHHQEILLAMGCPHFAATALGNVGR